MKKHISIIFISLVLFPLLCSQAFTACPSADLTGDCFVGFEDFAIMASKWLSGNPDIPDDMTYIPSGGFEMGDHHGDGSSSELPLHPVLLDSFFMGKYEITNQQYCDYLNSAYPNQIKVVNGVVSAVSGSVNGYPPYCDTSTANPASQINFSSLRRPYFSVRTKGGRNMSDDPMVRVSWYGAVAYCNWRSSEEGYYTCYHLSTWVCDFTKHGYRLATEAEWEYAARGGEHNPYYRFPWGDTISHSQANYEADPCSYSYDVSPTSGYHPLWNDGGDYPYTSPVGFFDGTMKYKVDYNWPGSATSYQTTNAANGYGLYDMAGNVWERCNDWWDSSYYNSSPYDNPQGPASGGLASSRVLRGGSWYSGSLCRVADKNDWIWGPGRLSSSFGFRIVLDLE